MKQLIKWIVDFIISFLKDLVMKNHIEKLEKDILDLEDGLSIINQLRPRTFKYNGRTVREDDAITRYGFIADEVLEVASNYVSIGKELLDGEMVDDFKSLSTIKMIPMMVNAIKELSAENNDLKSRIEALENK